MDIKSPITGSNNIRKIEDIDSGDIMKLYSEFNVGMADRFFVNTKAVSIYECLDTGYRFYYPFNISGDEDFYALLQKFPQYYSEWKWEHELAFAQIFSKSKVLEIGCGSGDFLYELSRRKKCECVGLELNSQAIVDANSKKVVVYQEMIEEHAMNNKNKYDVVCFFQVLEHISDVKSFLNYSIACLKKNGLLIIGVPNNNPYLFQNDKLHTLNLPPHHMGLWDSESLKNLEKYFDLELKSLMIEPLFEFNYFWSVKKGAWKKNNKFAYYFSKFIPGFLNGLRNELLRKFFDGRNILAIYSKK